MPHIAFETLVGFALTSLIIELTPGPNMTYLAIVSLTEGRQAGFAAVLGVALGLLGVGIATALGLATAISNSVAVYEGLRWLGVAYLLWLAWDGWRDAGETSPRRTPAHNGRLKYFTRGLITNLLNPKAAMFYIAILPAFIDPAQPVTAQTVTLSLVYVIIATLIHGSIVAAAGAARPFLEDENRSRLVRRALALVLAGIAIWFAAATAR